jgi:hypothetical protein
VVLIYRHNAKERPRPIKPAPPPDVFEPDDDLYYWPPVRHTKAQPKWCPKTTRRLTDQQRREAVARREAGETLTDIARSYDVNHSTISRLCRRDTNGAAHSDSI